MLQDRSLDASLLVKDRAVHHSLLQLSRGAKVRKLICFLGAAFKRAWRCSCIYRSYSPAESQNSLSSKTSRSMLGTCSTRTRLQKILILRMADELLGRNENSVGGFLAHENGYRKLSWHSPDLFLASIISKQRGLQWQEPVRRWA